MIKQIDTSRTGTPDQITSDKITTAAERAIKLALSKNGVASGTKNEYWGNTLHICVETLPCASNVLRPEKIPVHVSIQSTTLGSRGVLSVSVDKTGKPDFGKPYYYEAPNSSTDWQSRLNDSYIVTIRDYGALDADKKTDLLRREQTLNALYNNPVVPRTTVRRAKTMRKNAITKWRRPGWKVEN